MGTSALMNIGTRAMFANLAALQTVGNNIANANTPGYSRQELQLETAKGQYTGAGFFGQGVNVTTVVRSYDRFLTTQASDAKALAEADGVRMEQLLMLEKLFPMGKDGLGQAAREMLDGFVDVATNPQDPAARQVVLQRAHELAARFKSAGEQMDELQTGITQDLRSSVGTVNALARQVADINQQLIGLRGSGHSPNDLLDQRDRLVQQISGYINVTSIGAEDGSVGLFIGGGMSLVLGSNANTLTAADDPYDPAKVQLGLQEGPVKRLVPTNSIAGGSISGLLRFQNQDLPAARNLIGQLAVAISGAVNHQQSLGLDLGTPPGAGVPVFAVGAPRALSAGTNTGSATLNLSVVDASRVQASDYELRYDGTQYALMRLSDGQAAGGPWTDAQLAAGVQFEGLQLQRSAGTAAAGDRFLLQATAGASSTMKAVLDDPRGLAAASRVSAGWATTNTGTARTESVGLVNPAAHDPALSARISFSSDSGDYTLDLVDASNTVVSSSTGTWSAGTPITANGFSLTLTGVPRNGDSVTVGTTTAPGSNNGNALAFVGLVDAALVGARTLGGGLTAPGRSFTDAYAGALSDIGVRVQSAKSAAGISSGLAAAAETARSNKSGVNLDEEAARLLQYQQSYQAAAKMLQIATSVFDTLLQTAGG